MEGEEKKDVNVEEKSKDIKKEDDVKTEELVKNKIDEESVRKQGVDEYLKKLGVDSDEIQEIIGKHKEEEEKNSTELQRAQKELKKALKLLNEEKEKRSKAEAQIEAIKLGAKPELVEDLIVVAMSKAGENKDIQKVIAEIKSGSTGSVYFGIDEDNDDDKGGTTVTRRSTGGVKKSDSKKESKAGSLAEQIVEDMNKNKAKKSFWG